MKIELKNVNVDIPIYLPGYNRLFKRPSFLVKSTGANVILENKSVSVNAIRNFSLDVKNGDRLGLIGHNGAGKSTLLKVIAKIIPYSSGHMEIKGIVGCIFGSESNFSPDLSGRELIDYYLKVFSAASNYQSYKEDIISFSELGDYIDLPVRVYSAGMSTRLIAALLTSIRSDILLIDEGIGVGDLAFQNKFAKRLDNFLYSASILIFASHSFELLKQYCKQGLVLKHGEIMFQGNIEEAISIYKKDLEV